MLSVPNPLGTAVLSKLLTCTTRAPAAAGADFDIQLLLLADGRDGRTNEEGDDAPMNIQAFSPTAARRGYLR